MKRVAIIQSNYIPWKGYFDMIRQVDEFVYLDDVQYTKNDWRNRNIIKSRDGLQWLTIPVQHEYLGQTIREKKVASKGWAKKHWHALTTNYGGSKWFNAYRKDIYNLYKQAESMRFLIDINHLFISKICNILDINTPLFEKPRYPDKGEKNRNIIEMCHKIEATHYLTSPAARNYINEELFIKEGIKVEWIDYGNYPEYAQFYLPFEHWVTILDLIFHTGPHALKYINGERS